MLFNSYEFVFAFMPIVVAGFYLLGRTSRGGAILWLILASLFFYAWWRPINILLIAPSIMINFGLARVMLRHGSARPALSKTLLVIGVVFNLCFLGYFKYFNFMRGVANDLLGANLVLTEIILPLGISFITFQKIAFLVDVHAGRVKYFTIRDYCLFVLFFPQLIAGPIVHYREIMPQFEAATCRFHGENLAIGLTLFFFGLAKKLVFADSVVPFIAPAFQGAASGAAPSLIPAWIAAIAFMLQIYFDFSGYSDMAIGLARMFGVKLPMNFNSPLRASSISEFWARWHMTLTRFLTAYLYNPILLNITRRRAAKGLPIGVGTKDATPGSFLVMVAFPTLLTMTVAGAWHGAGYQFLLFGLAHGLMIAVNHAWRAARPRFWPNNESYIRFMRPVGFLLTFFMVVWVQVLFRSRTLHATGVMWRSMLGLNGVTLPHAVYDHVGPAKHWLDAIGIVPDWSSGHVFSVSLLWTAALLFIALALPNTMQWLIRFEPALGVKLRKNEAPPRFGWAPSTAWAVGTAIVAACGILALGQLSPFLYLAVLMSSPLRFCVTFAVALFAVLAAVAGFNAIVDPYDVLSGRRIAGVNLVKPAAANHTRLTKLYQLSRVQPVSVIVGTSREDIGLDPESPVWPADLRPVFDVGLPGSTLYERFRYLREADKAGTVRLAVIGLGIDDFLYPIPARLDSEQDEERLRIQADGSPNSSWRLQRLKDGFLTLLSRDALLDSIATVLAQRDPNAGNITPAGSTSEGPFHGMAHQDGVQALFAQKEASYVVRIREQAEQFSGPASFGPGLDYVRAMLEFCRERGIRVILILPPYHADLLQIYEQAGLWTQFETLKVSLASLAERFNATPGNPGVTLWDFTGYNQYSTEKVPAAGDRKTDLRWFWEPQHFKKALGRLILERILTGQPEGLGAQLTPATVAEQNDRIRAERDAYLARSQAMLERPISVR